jgi:hypothetical protein
MCWLSVCWQLGLWRLLMGFKPVGWLMMVCWLLAVDNIISEVVGC